MIELMFAYYIQAKSPPDDWKIAEVSAYTASVEECDSSPDITASGKRVKNGFVAMNGVKFGTVIEIEGMGTYEVQDRMNRRYKNNIDVFMNSKSEALAFGRQELKYRILDK